MRAHAKLNLCLAVAPPEPEGPKRSWHRIASWFHAIELHDEVELLEDAGHDIAWADGSPIDWPLDKDLAVRALESLAPGEAPIGVRVRKSVPAGGGLGGGSADAAAVLRKLTSRDPTITLDDARTAARSLGSDIEFFLDGDDDRGGPPRPAFVSRFGDALERGKRHAGDTGVVLIVPPFGCSTPEVYRAFDALDLANEPGAIERFNERAERARSLSADLRPPFAVSEELFNDLEPAACAAHPELGDLLAAARGVCRVPVHMTGSGSTLFALCPPGAEDQLAADLDEHLAGRGCRVVQTLLA
ncbi:MAG: hypothetical protein AAGG07_07750 [Planctomycetota bacterium]